jgi:hypothetical protein
MPFELPLPTKRTVLPLPMHAVNAAKHPRKPPTLVDGQGAGSVIHVWLSQVIFTKHCNNILAKPVHGFMSCGLAHAYVIVNKITWHSICKLPNGRGTFLVRGEADLTGAIILGLEVVIVVSDAIENDQKQFSGHPIAMTKFLCFIYRLDRVEVVLVQAQMASFSIAIDIALPLLG